MSKYNEKIDIPLMLWRLAPTAEYHWKGNGYGIYADIGEWRSPDIPKPTESEVYAEWTKYQSEPEIVPTLDMNMTAYAKSLTGVSIDRLTPDHVRMISLLWLRSVNAVTDDGKIKPFDQWLK